MEELELQKTRRALSGWPMVIAWAGMLLFACHASTHMVGAGDTWVAMACGRHFINQGVDAVEPFSANSHKPGPTEEEVKTWPGWAQRIVDTVGLETVKKWHPTGWVNQNWLTHVLFYWLTHLSPFADAEEWSFNALVYWKFALYILTIICVYYTGRVLGAHPALSAAFSCFALFIGRSFLDIRPAGFSNLLVAAFLLILVLTTYRSKLYVWLIVPLTVFWANLHGGYIYVWIVLAPFVVLHVLTILPRRWTVAVHCVLTWLGLYMAVYKFTSHAPYNGVAPLDDKFFILLVLLAAGGLVMAGLKSVKNPAIYAYHIIVSLIVFLVLFSRLLTEGLSRYPNEIAEYVQNSQKGFVIAFAAAVAVGIIVSLLNNRLVQLKPKAIIHTAAAGFVALVAAIVVNPFHLTNITHTFIISVSENAEGWRNVHEWWPAFAWTNPVGTGFPFMIMLILAVGLLALYLFGRLLVPRLVKGPKSQLDLQERRFGILVRILGYGLAILVCWAASISLSLTDVSIPGFLVCGLFVAVLLVSVRYSVHFIYLCVPLILFAMYTGNPDKGYYGRFFYTFMIIPAYVVICGVALLLSPQRKRKWTEMIFVAATAIVGLIVIRVAINPFGSAQPVWHLEQFVNPPRLWHPMYERNLRELTLFHNEHLFTVLYVLNGVALVGWFAVPFLKSLFGWGAGDGREASEAVGDKQEETYSLGKIDLAMITIAAMTVYMAVRSRRFIPIAGIAMCPLMAMLIDRLSRVVSAARNFHKSGRLVVPSMRRGLQQFFATAGLVVVAVLGIHWCMKFKRVYLDPWPTEARLNSAFIRMTASHMKPFYACQFIRDNKLEGKMLNYWTEGGFIAWGQVPDPNTGRTPLRLFMDGRAQAAYDYKAYIRWAEIMAGGPTVQESRIRKRRLTKQEYQEVGKWIDEQLKPHDVWLIMMPITQFNTPFVRALESMPRKWPMVFINDKQKLFADIESPQGRRLFDGVMTGQTKYPDAYSQKLIVAYHLLTYGSNKAARSQGLEMAIEAFKLNPSKTPLELIHAFRRYSGVRERVNGFYRAWLDDFTENKDKYADEHGYYHRLTGGLAAAEYFENVAKAKGDAELAAFYRAKKEQFVGEFDIVRDKRW